MADETKVPGHEGPDTPIDPIIPEPSFIPDTGVTEPEPERLGTDPPAAGDGPQIDNKRQAGGPEEHI